METITESNKREVNSVADKNTRKSPSWGYIGGGVFGIALIFFLAFFLSSVLSNSNSAPNELLKKEEVFTPPVKSIKTVTTVQSSKKNWVTFVA